MNSLFLVLRNIFIRIFFTIKKSGIDYVAEKEDPKWLKIALKEIGVKEIPGSAASRDIIEYHSYVTKRFTSDEVSWCSSFICFCMETAGYTSTNSAIARSWLEWGVPVERPVKGCVVVFWRYKKDSWKGHVGFFIKQDDKYVYCLGGNQSDSVNITKYRRSKVLGYRMPKT